MNDDGGAIDLPDAVDTAMHQIFGLPPAEQAAAFAALRAAHPQYAALLQQRYDAVTSGDDESAPVILDQLASRYRIEATIGEGGMGEVLRAWDALLQRPVAIKVVRGRGGSSAAQLERFRTEARITAQLDHPGVVPVHDLGTDATGRAYFVMRLVVGRSADEVLAMAGPAANSRHRARALETLLKVCDTLAYAHQRGIVHRDLKPANVMVGAFGEVYVMDWGLAKSTSVTNVAAAPSFADDTAPGATLAGTVLGTPSYMPPERVDGQVGPPDPRADVYAVGAMLYQVLTGVPPYGGEPQPTARSIIEALRRGPPEPIQRSNPTAPPELIAICDKAMARVVAERYATVSELAEDLRAFLDARTVKAHRTGPWVELRLWVRRNRTLAATFALAAVLGTIALVIVLVAWRGADVSNHRFRRLASVVQLEQACQRADTLYPPWPQQIGALRAWLAEFVEPLERERSLLAAELQQIVARALPPPPGTFKEASPPRFNDPDDAILYSSLLRHESELAVFFGNGGVVERVRERLHWAENIHAASVSEHQAAWARARAVAGADGPYAGLALAEQIGLVPVGSDPATGLLEFGDLRSGSLPRRDAQGLLQYDEGSGIVFVLLPGGDAWIGAQTDDPARPNYWAGAKLDESPVEQVRVVPFFMAKHELTQAQWQRLAGYNPSQSIGVASARHPVGHLTWLEAERVLRENGLDLPTEAQWEYACRAGSSSAWCTGNQVGDLCGYANIADETTRGRFGPGFRFEAGFDDGWATDAPVGTFTANRFGLHDMHGNHGEWCLDVYASRRTLHPPGVPGIRAGTAIHRVYRGGSYAQPADNFARSAYRGMGPVDTTRHDLGVRAARRVE